MSKILVIDDDIDILDVVKMILETNDFTVSTTQKWEDILGSIARFVPDLILLDISLSGADGRFICKELKEHNPTANIPVILFSANQNMEDKFKDFCADGFIAKPFEVADLISKINMFLN